MLVDVSQKHLKIICLMLFLFTAFQSTAQNITIQNAFAHNDYWHKRPLYDALDNGYSHVEADIYLRSGKLVVAHLLPIFKKKRTLEQLYFKPLLEATKGTNKNTTCPVDALMLMIDIKSDADKTYAKLCELLESYKEILSSYENGKIIKRQVTVVITGKKPYQILKKQHTRLAFIDEDLMKVKQDTLSSGVYQTASCKYSNMTKWDGNGAMPEEDRQRLCAYVAAAHQYQKKVRLWASPEKKEVWKELLACGVDLINTNKLAELKDFLLATQKSYAQSDPEDHFQK